MSEQKANRILDLLNSTVRSNPVSEEIKLSLEELADAACTSERTTERIFQNVLHSPFRKYLSRLRIEYAAHLIQNTNSSIVEIARKVGYTPSSFSKEFKKQFKCTAATFRKEKRSLQICIKPLNFETVKLPEMHLAYLSHIGDYKYLSTINSECELFDCITELTSSENIIKHPAQYYGIAFDDETIRRVKDCRFYACVEIHKPIKARNYKVPLFNTISIPQGAYAKFTHVGSYSQLSTLYEDIFHNLLFNPEITFCLNAEAYILEHYINDIQDTQEGNLITEILIPIK